MKVDAIYLFKSFFDFVDADESIDATDLIPCGSVEAVDFTDELGFECTEIWPSVKMRDGTFS